ncbi:MAG: FadR family transcriptional regulator [Victivallales bacterium]|nr:FadR family transcriptional regulator [Victivallales bacterium]
MGLPQLKTHSTLESAIEAIQNYITQNRLGMGDPLPPENTLSTELGISRNIVREAMQHFRTLGIIVSKQRIGPTIARLMPKDPYENYMPFLDAEADRLLPSLSEARYALEVGSAELIVRNATAEDLRKLNDICRQMNTEMDYQQMIRLDGEFHKNLMNATHNPIICGMVPLLVNFFNEKFRPQTEHKDFFGAFPQRIIDEHQAIVKALEDKNPEEMRINLESHVKHYLTRGKTPRVK